MEIREALQVIRALAAGTDPENSQPLSPDSILLRPQVVKALNRGLSALAQQEEWERNKPTNAGKYWSREEEAKVCEEVRQGIDFHEIAKTHNRTVGSIVARLVKLGKIAPKTSSNQAA
jgi:DNA-binding NarL/FixJ family response regulator